MICVSRGQRVYFVILLASAVTMLVWTIWMLVNA